MQQRKQQKIIYKNLKLQNYYGEQQTSGAYAEAL